MSYDFIYSKALRNFGMGYIIGVWMLRAALKNWEDL